jgi:anti-anti-sigma regulatory factor/DNA-binding HxlR family transcriptional regulator
MAPRFYVDDEFAISLVEESKFFRMRIQTPEVEEYHVEEFMDTTVEWLSTNPKKGILIDFNGVKSVCSDFAVHLARYYADIKKRGLNVRFVNVDPAIEPYIDVSNITVVLSDVSLHKPVVNAREILDDLAGNLSDRELMKKHGLSEKGLASMFRKLLHKGVISRSALAQRLGVETSEIAVGLEGLASGKPVISAADVLRDIAENMTDTEIMRKYKLSRKGLQSLLRKLYQRGLISKVTLLRRKGLSK